MPAYTKKSDIYSLGITFFEIAAREFPYEGCNSFHIQNIVMENKRPKMPRAVPEKFSALMQWCWKHEPQERPEAEEVIKALNVFS